jgi:hypothetical protein
MHPATFGSSKRVNDRIDNSWLLCRKRFLAGSGQLGWGPHKVALASKGFDDLIVPKWTEGKWSEMKPDHRETWLEKKRGCSDGAAISKSSIYLKNHGRIQYMLETTRLKAPFTPNQPSIMFSVPDSLLADPRSAQR